MSIQTQSKSHLRGARLTLVMLAWSMGALMAGVQGHAQAAASASMDQFCAQKRINPVPREAIQTLRESDPRLGAMDYGWGPAAKDLDQLTRRIGGLPHGTSHAHIFHANSGRMLHYSVCDVHNCGNRSVNYLYTLGKINRGIALYYDEGHIRYLGHPTPGQRRLLLAAACTND